MKKTKRTAGILLTFLFALFLSVTAFAAGTEKKVTWSGISLDVYGNASWTLSNIPENLVVQKYEVKVARKSGGTWSENYRSLSTDEDGGMEITFSSVGIYRFKVRAKFIGGDFSQWSASSPEVSVSSDYIEPGAGGGSGRQYSGGPGVQGGGTQYSGGPGANSGATLINSAPGTSAPPAAGTSAAGGLAYGWNHDARGYRYVNAQGIFLSGWNKIGNDWYYFGADSYMQTGWILTEGKWYLCLPDGKLATGWQNVNEKWYYLDPATGIMLTGYQMVGGRMYYMLASGERLTNGYSPEGAYFGPDGARV